MTSNPPAETTIYQVSTFFQAMCVTAMLKAEERTPAKRHVLLVTNSSAVPEITPSVHQTPGFEVLAEYFDDVIDFNKEIWPQHPRGFRVDETMSPVVEAGFRAAWNLGDSELRLWLSWAPTMPPGLSLAKIFRSASISIHFDGLMSYGPLPGTLPTEVLHRLESVEYLDLLPGVVPTLLPSESIARNHHSVDSLREVFDEVASRISDDDFASIPSGDYAIIIGQYLGNLELISADEELVMHKEMIDEAASSGLTRVVFKPHPSTQSSLTDLLIEYARESHVELTVLESVIPVEIIFAKVPPKMVVSCFSTALATAHRCYSLETRGVWTRQLLESLSPFENSNRIPLTIADLVYAGKRDEPDPETTNALIHTISYCMKPTVALDLRPIAIDFLSHHYPSYAKYFKRRRLTMLDLPGKLPPKPDTGSKKSLKKAVLRRARKVLGRIRP